MHLDALFRLVLLVFPLMFSPGPTNFLCASVGGRHGFARTIFMILGMDVMVFVPALFVGVSLGGVLSLYPHLLIVVQLIGAIVILAIAAGMARTAGAPAVAAARETPIGFFGGMLVQMLNAKGIALLLIIYAQFQTFHQTVIGNALIVAFYLTILSLLSHGIWAAGGMWIARRFSSPRALRMQGYVYAGMLALVSLWMLHSAFSDWQNTA